MNLIYLIIFLERDLFVLTQIFTTTPNLAITAPIDANKKILTQEDGEKTVTKHNQPYSISAYNSANLIQVIIVGFGRTLIRKLCPTMTGKELHSNIC